MQSNTAETEDEFKMKKKKRKEKNRKYRILIAAMAIILLLTACGGSGGYSGAADYAMANVSNFEERIYDFDEADDYGGAFGVTATSNRLNAETPALDSNKSSDNNNVNHNADNDASQDSQDNQDNQNETRPRKLIFSASIQLETTEFEQTAQALSDLVEQMGGYFSNSDAGERGSGHKWGNYTARIPAAKFDLFLQQAGELAHETRRNVSRQDVSENYYDTDGRLKTQKAKLDRLQDLLEKAETVEDMITIESAIAETEYEIDSLSGELRHYDNLVDYSTVEISLEEVYRFTEVDEVPESYGSMLASAFVSGLQNFTDWLEDLTVAIAYNWIWILLFIALLLIFIKLGKAGKLSLKPKFKNHISQTPENQIPVHINKNQDQNSNSTEKKP